MEFGAKNHLLRFIIAIFVHIIVTQDDSHCTQNVHHTRMKFGDAEHESVVTDLFVSKRKLVKDRQRKGEIVPSEKRQLSRSRLLVCASNPA